MSKKLSALCAATAAAMAFGCFSVSAEDAQDAPAHSLYYNSAMLLGVDDYGNQTGFSSVTDITGISAVTFTFRLDEAVAKKAASGDIELTGTLGTDSDTLGLVSHEWSFVPYKLDENGDVVYGDDLMPVSDKELTMERIMDGFYCITLENPTGFFKDQDTFAKLWFDCDTNDYEVELTGVVLSFDDSKIVRDLCSAKMSLSKTSYTYTGSACKPKATVTYGNKTLKEGTDYTLSYKNNVSAGTATVTATGKGKYKGTASSTFKIKTASVSGATVAFSSLTFPYTGSAVKPSPTVKVGSKTLKLGTDYTLKYTNNTAVGTAVIKITGKGNYSGSISKAFTITPKATVIKKATSPSSGKAKVTWAKNTSGSGYQVLYSTSSSFSSSKKKTINSNATLSTTISSLTKGKTYYFKVRAFKKIDDRYIYGAYSSVKSVTVK